MKKGFVVSFSGLDSSGKTTQIEMLKEYLDKNEYKYKYLWMRGGYTPLFEFIKRLIRKIPSEKIPPPGVSESHDRAFKNNFIRKVWLAIAFGDLVLFNAVYIRYLLYRNYIVLLDRNIWDTLVDFSINFPAENVRKWLLWRILKGFSPKPDMAIFLTIPPKESIRRGEIKKEPFPQSIEILSKRFEMYQVVLKESAINVLDGMSGKEEIFEEIVRGIKKIIHANR